MARLIYFIAMTNRTGSSWLCSMLRSTGVVGDVNEWSLQETTEPCLSVVEAWRHHENADPYGLKLASPDIHRLWPIMSAQDRRNAKWIWLTRRDKHAQALSWWKAGQTHQWHLEGPDVQPVDFTRPMPPIAMRDTLEEIQQKETEWAKWFASREFLSVVYEDVCNNPTKETRRMVGYLGKEYQGQVNTNLFRQMAT